MTYNFQYSAFRVVIFTAIVRNFYNNFMTGDSTFAFCLWNINIFGELMVVSNDKTEAFTIGIRSH